MTYRALYREWRPQYFYDIVGQKHIVLTLKNALKNKRIGHAYLFCGPRGTGKTSTAKVFAKALNCLNPQENEPCNKCDICLTISSGTSIDVIEIDAASNRGIDEIRDLKEKVKFSPSRGKFKVYIIDEVHMLTNEAFNALLKTLEEPPEHVIFILATTEPQKVPLTILSRCQRFDFKPISVNDIVGRLEEVLQSLKIETGPAAVYQIAGTAEGSLRDALSILDQIITFGDETKISENDVHNLLGTVNKDIMNRVLENILSGDIAGVLHVIANMSSEGKDLGLFFKEFIGYIRGLLLAGIDSTLVVNEQQPDYEQKATFDTFFLLTVLNHLIDYETKMKWSSQPRIVLELAFIKLLCQEQKNDPAAVLNTNLRDIKSYKTNNKGRVKEEKEVVLKQTAVVSKNDEKAVELSLHRVQQAWKDIVQEVRRVKSSVSGPISASVPLKIDGKILTVGLEDELHKQWLDNNSKRDLIKQVIKSVLGFELEIKFVNKKDKGQESKAPQESINSNSIMNLFEAQEIKND